ncbi:hypothetical protein [Piscinibacter sp.]|jgi:hypothetical protein|uniref:hypothetical protein n=1 Tax=Piscinibacter sp. TaxID=1903157 RepID=UPI0035599808
MADAIASLNERETTALNVATELTEAHLRVAVEIVHKVMKNDSRFTDGALLGAVVQALAVNFVGLLSTRP